MSSPGNGLIFKVYLLQMVDINRRNESVLSVKDLRIHFHTADGIAKAVDGVSYNVYPGETLGVVGESGCGKSVSALSILRLIPIPPGAIESGAIHFEGQNLLELPMRKMREIRGNRISMIFQEPMTSLNPLFTIGFQLSKVFTLHQKLPKKKSQTTIDRHSRRLRDTFPP